MWTDEKHKDYGSLGLLALLVPLGGCATARHASAL